MTFSAGLLSLVISLPGKAPRQGYKHTSIIFADRHTCVSWRTIRLSSSTLQERTASISTPESTPQIHHHPGHMRLGAWSGTNANDRWHRRQWSVVTKTSHKCSATTVAPPVSVPKTLPALCSKNRITARHRKWKNRPVDTRSTWFKRTAKLHVCDRAVLLL